MLRRRCAAAELDARNWRREAEELQDDLRESEAVNLLLLEEKGWAEWLEEHCPNDVLMRFDSD